MKYRKFGNTELTVSEIGFGSWAIGGDAMVGGTAIGWGKADDITSKAAIHAALDAGINFFDTADIYGLGHSESLLGEVLTGNQQAIIATKVGNVARNNQFTTDYTKSYIIQACEASLKRLRRETIDYYQLHSARVQQLQQGECIEAMQQLHQQGKIRYWGISLNTFTPDAEANYFMEHGVGNGFQLVLNMINQKALPVIKEAAAKGYGIIARMPLQFGLLTGKFDTNTKFAVSDHRHNRLTSDVIDRSLRAVEPLWELCNKYQITKTQLALSYILSYSEVSTVIPGIRTPEHVRDNTTGLIQLSSEDRALIESYGQNSFNELMQLIEKQG
jgi:aryl-alcohol dehydrogenase-like predicted oxidoreductase